MTNNKTKHDTIDDICDFPYWAITDVLESDAADGKHEKNDDNELAIPSAMNSWLGPTW